MNIAHVYAGPKQEAFSSLGFWLVNELLRQNGFNAQVFTLESKKSLEKMNLEKADLALVTLHFEHKIPLLYTYFKGFKKPIIVGGPLTVNPYPMIRLAHAFYVGDAEAKLISVMEELESGASVETLSDILFLSSLENEARYHYAKLRFHPVNMPPSLFGDFMIELVRGCSMGCRFCLLGYTQRPPRFRDHRQVKKLLEIAKEKGHKKVAFIGSDCLAHPKAKEILKYTLDLGLRFSLSSLRADRVDLEILELLKMNGTKSITIAPESLSERIRFALNKKISDDVFVWVCENAKTYGIKKLKVYLLLGFPLETDRDILEGKEFLKKICSGFRAKISVNAIIPKPHTPFEALPLEKELEKKNKLVKKMARELKLRLNLMNPKRARTQTVLSVGDAKIAELLKKAHECGLNWSAWRKFASLLGFDLNSYLYGPREMPWKRIDIGITAKFLKGEYRKALELEPTSSCPGKCPCGLCRLSSPF